MADKTPNIPDFAAILRAAIIASGKSQYELAKETEISQGRIGTFLRADDEIRSDNLSKLAHAVGLELVPRRARKPRLRRGGVSD